MVWTWWVWLHPTCNDTSVSFLCILSLLLFLLWSSSAVLVFSAERPHPPQHPPTPLSPSCHIKSPGGRDCCGRGMGISKQGDGARIRPSQTSHHITDGRFRKRDLHRAHFRREISQGREGRFMADGCVIVIGWPSHDTVLGNRFAIIF